MNTNATSGDAAHKITGTQGAFPVATGSGRKHAKINERNAATERDDIDREAALERGQKPCACCEAPELSYLPRSKWNLCPVCASEQTP